MVDVQNRQDMRGIEINKVGVKNVEYPVTFLDGGGKRHETIARVNMYISLTGEFKGTHMSRFMEILQEYHRKMELMDLKKVLVDMKERLGSENGYLELSFPYFMNKKAPVSEKEGLMNYKCEVKGGINGEGEVDMIWGVVVPVTTLCPCSKEVSLYGAHNQRSEIRLEVRMEGFEGFEELIILAESVSSCELYSVLKRVDEKYVTECAYNKPLFVEDVVRELVLKLESDGRMLWYKVESENFESIHNHNAYALVERRKG